MFPFREKNNRKNNIRYQSTYPKSDFREENLWNENKPTNYHKKEQCASTILLLNAVLRFACFKPSTER